MAAGLGLSAIATSDLEDLLRAVHRGMIECPLSPVGLASIRMQDTANALLDHLRGLDERAVRAVLVAVLAERRQQHDRPTPTSVDS